MNDTAVSGLKIIDPSASYTTRTYAVEVFGSVEHNSLNPSLLARVRNSLVRSINNCIILPRIIVVVLEDELLNEVKTNDYGLSQDYSRRIKWLMNEFRKVIDTINDYVPQNAKSTGFPKFLWISPTRHRNYKNNALRKKFGSCIEAQAKLVENTTCLRLVQKWDFNDSSIFLEQEQRFSNQGKFDFWAAVDKTIEFYDTIYNTKSCHRSKREDSSQEDKDNSRHQRYYRIKEEPRFKLPPPSGW